MAVNTLQYADKIQTFVDEQLIKESTTAWMEGNAGNVQYSGGREVKIPKTTVTGLGDYSRSGGYPDGGAVSLAYETFTLTKDRAQRFNIDAMDVDETNFVPTIGRILNQFQREQVIPEIDSYRYSKIFSLANQKLKTGSYTPSAATIYSTLTDQIKDIQDAIGDAYQLVVMMSGQAAKVLSKSTEISKYTIVGDQNFINGNINTKVKMLDGTIPIIEVPSSRLKSAFNFNATAGFSADALAMQINWIIIIRSAPVAITKSEKIKIIAPETNQDYDGWSLYYRRYHDLWIFDNQFAGVRASYIPIDAPALTIVVTAGAKDKTKWTATPAIGNSLAYKMQDTAGTDKYNDIPTDITAYASGAEISATAGKHMLCYELDPTGHVVKFTDHTLAAGDIGA